MTQETQKSFFDREGYLILEGLLSPQELRTCNDEIDRLHALAADMEARGQATADFQREPFAGDARRPDGLPILRKVEQTWKYSPFLDDISRKPRLIKTVQSLIGDDVLRFRSTLMLKPAFHGSTHRFHQDSSYWPIDPPRLVTVSIALNDATPENGCLQVIPRSHEWGLQDWGTIAAEKDSSMTPRTDIDTSTARHIPLKAGTALLFHSLTVHGSGPNESPRPRHTALYAYFSPHVRYVPGPGQPRSITYPVVGGLGGQNQFTLTADEAPS